MRSEPFQPVRTLVTEGAWPSFSPDGETLVYTGDLWQGRRRLMTVAVAAKRPASPAPLTPPELQATRPTWSWKSGEIAFTREPGVIYTLKLDAGRCQPYLTDGPAESLRLLHPSWYPDGGSLAAVGFTDGRSGRQGILYRLQRGSPTPLEPLTRFPDVCAGRPSVGPDGRSIAFSGNAGGFDQTRNQVWIVTPPQAPRRLEGGEPLSAFQGRAPSWSPDGRWIAFVSTRPANAPTKETRKAIWVVSAKGGEATQLTDPAHDPAQVAWSRDQHRIAFGSFTHGVGVIDVPERFQP